MRLTDTPDLMEVFVELFVNRARRPVDEAIHDIMLRTSAAETYLEAPMSALDASPKSLAEVYGRGGNLLAHLAEITALHGDPEVAELLVELEKIVSNQMLYIEFEPKRSRRFVEYVYPVV